MLTGGGTYTNLRWSPDDKTIAFLEDMKVMVVSAAGGKPVPSIGSYPFRDSRGLRITRG